MKQKQLTLERQVATIPAVKAFRVECKRGLHNYRQGEDMKGNDELRRVLYCVSCGDQLRLGLPAE